MKRGARAFPCPSALHLAATLFASAAAVTILVLSALAPTSAALARAATVGQAVPPNLAAVSQVASDADVRGVCGTACHRLPPPDVLPRASWHDTIVRMSLMRAGQIESQTTFKAHSSALPEDMRRALAYYEARAPEALPAPESWPALDPEQPPRFERRAIAPPGAPSPGVSNVALLDIAGDGRLELVISDMRHGFVLAHRPYMKDDGFALVGSVPHPAHTAVTDLDGDGIKDLLVADLGSFLPGDHELGAAIWLRGQRAYGPFLHSPLGSGLPRVADVEAADFDGDGDLDLVVAAFGWRKTGSLLLLDQRSRPGAAPVFEARALDSRTGAIHAVPADVNRDGRPDIVVLFAQEHETVAVFINEGTGRFRTETVYVAPHPNWGSSGIQVVDVDTDGDLDVLLTHGDTFDDLIVKPYHGIQWLENRGTFPYVEHTLASLPGVHRAAATDLDGDGDLDVIAVARVPNAGDNMASKLASVVWLEQVKPGEFRRHTLEMGAPTHATMDVGDFDLDGDIDFVVGNFSNPGGSPATWVEIWENKTK